jgi:DedD protein
VQLGSFASQATAAGMIKGLRTRGYDAFVMPVKSGGATLYRVRIGPVKDRESALAILHKVKEAAPGAAVVPHP